MGVFKVTKMAARFNVSKLICVGATLSHFILGPSFFTLRVKDFGSPFLIYIFH